MHILMTVNAAWNIWNFRRPLVSDFLAAGHRITILAPGDDTVSDLERLGCRFVRLDMDVKGLNPLQDLRLIQRFKRILRAECPDAILSYTIKNNIFGAMAARSCGIPFIPNVTGLGTAFLSGGVLQTVAEGLYRHAFGSLPIVFFQNSDDRDLFIARKIVQPKQAQLLPGSGINLVRFAAAELPLETEPPIFLMIARLLRDKGVFEYFEAAQQVKAQVPQARFQLLGAVGAENRAAIDAATVQGWMDEGIIEHLGTANDVRPIIAKADCIVLPSYREGAPRTLIEAAAMARPLIATDVPGCRAIVDHDVSGFLCEVRNGESLAAACLRFLSLDRPARIAMGRAGREKMEREFDESIVVGAYRNAISNMTRAA